MKFRLNRKDTKFLKKALRYVCLGNCINAFIDLYLWFTIGYNVPCWTISVLVIFYGTLIFLWDKIR